MTSDDFLEHVGVKGMRWGVRKSSGTNKVRTNKRGGRAYDISKMSNKDLRNVVKRMELEKQYNELNKKSASEGKIFAKKQLLKVGEMSIAAAVGLGLGVAADHYKPQLVKMAPKVLPGIAKKFVK